jgi:hypothetical protein
MVLKQRMRQYNQGDVKRGAIPINEQHSDYSGKNPYEEQILDADEMAKRCRRLVVLGGPGSGKTWLAKRTARLSAEAALEALAAGSPVEEIDLPLYTTCSLMATATGDIRQAAVSSAFNQLGDLGGSRISAALQRLFLDRNGLTLLVIDSIDEAKYPDDRLRQADTLPWRIVLTSRPSSWNQQLDIGVEGADPLRQIGTLQPLAYPEDVEPFIATWFERDPQRGAALVNNLAHRPDLQQVATIPLMLAFYCVISGNQPLPDTRRVLYERVLNRMLTGRWRRGGGYPEQSACLAVLQSWAWEGAVNASDPRTQIGAWRDEITTSRVRLNEADREAVDHVATPLGSEDLDSKLTTRRFIHRSLREYLVASYVAGLTATEACKQILPHLWYDPDWEYAAPAAIAMHPERSDVLRQIFSRIGLRIATPVNAAHMIPETRRFLNMLASESSEIDWPPDLATAIGQARLESFDAHNSEVAGPPWRTVDAKLRKKVLTLLTNTTDPQLACDLGRRLSGLSPEGSDFREARRALLALLAMHPYCARRIAMSIVALTPTAVDMEQGRRSAFALLKARPDCAQQLAGALAVLKPDPNELATARKMILDELALCIEPLIARQLARALSCLEPGADELGVAKERISTLISRATPGQARGLAEVLLQLSPEMQEIVQVRQALLGLFSRARLAFDLRELIELLTSLDAGPAELEIARRSVLAMVRSTVDRTRAEILIETLAKTIPGQAGRAQLWRSAIPPSWSDRADTSTFCMLANIVASLDPNAGTAEQARTEILALVHKTSEAAIIGPLIEALTTLDPSADDLAQSRKRILGLLAYYRGRDQALPLVEALLDLQPLESDVTSARNGVLVLLAQSKIGDEVSQLAQSLVMLLPGAYEFAEARERVMELLANLKIRDIWRFQNLIEDLTGALLILDPTTSALAEARARMWQLIESSAKPLPMSMLVVSWLRLEPSEHEIQFARDFITRSIAGRRAEIANAFTMLNPDISMVQNWCAGGIVPSEELLAAARRKSSAEAWIDALQWIEACHSKDD